MASDIGAKPGDLYLLAAVRKWLMSPNSVRSGKLPPERELAAQFCVSRAEIRKVLSVLKEEGQIHQHVGRGTFLSKEISTSAAISHDEIIMRTSPLAAMQARFVIEPELAKLAALSASPARIDELSALCEAMRRVESWEAYAELDWQFHNAIAEATGNVLLIEFQRILNGVRRYVIWSNVDKSTEAPSSDYHSFDEHELILKAIASRDPLGAETAMRMHLSRTRAQIAGSSAVHSFEIPTDLLASSV